MMIKLFIFDMAGTTIDEDNLVYKQVRDSINHFGHHVSLETVLENGAGKEKWHAIKDVLAVSGIAANDEKITEMHQHFVHQLSQAYEQAPVKLFSPVRNLLVDLKKEGKHIAFNTGYSRNIALQLLQRVDLSLGNEIDYLVTADDVMNGRPAPDMVLKSCEHFDIHPSEAAVLGDSQQDVLAAKAAGVNYAIGVTTGAQTKDELMKVVPYAILRNIDHIRYL